jgi:uncharacterized protein YqeY
MMLTNRLCETRTILQRTLIKTQVKAVETASKEFKGTDDELVTSVLKTLVKQHQEAIELYEKGGNEERVFVENAEMDVIKALLPQQISEKDLVEIVDYVLLDYDSPTMKDMGKIMNKVKEMSAERGKDFDGKMVSTIVKEKII